jgi:hypothetical protein
MLGQSLTALVKLLPVSNQDLIKTLEQNTAKLYTRSMPCKVNLTVIGNIKEQGSRGQKKLELMHKCSENTTPCLRAHALTSCQVRKTIIGIASILYCILTKPAQVEPSFTPDH